MAQETRNVDYESMVEKYMNEWDGCNLREFCFSEKVNIYRMLKTMKKMGVKKDAAPYGLKPLEFSEMQEQHARELAEQKAADEERFRKMDEEHRIREAALESRIRELEDAYHREECTHE